jgi:hypothetical protein
MADFIKRVKIKVTGEGEVKSLGRAMGGTAGHAVTMGMRIKDLGEKLGGFNIALMGIAAGAIYAGKQLYEMANAPMIRLIEQTEASIKSAKELGTKIQEVFEGAAREAAGMGKMGETWLSARSKWYELDIKRADIEKQISEKRAEAVEAEGTIWSVAVGAQAETLTNLLNRVKGEMTSLGADIGALKPAAAKESSEELSKRWQEKRDKEVDQNKEYHDWKAASEKRFADDDAEAWLAKDKREADAQKESNDRKLELDRALMEQERDLQQQISEQHFDWQEQMYDQAEQLAQYQLEKQKQFAETVGDYTAAGAQVMVDAIAVGIESGGKAMARFLAKELKSIAISSAVKALYYYGEGIAWLFMDNPALSAKAFESAAVFTACAVAAGAGSAALGAMGGSDSGESGAGTKGERAEAQGKSDRGGSAGGSVTIIINGNLLGGRDSGKQIAQYLDDYYDGRNPGRAHDRVTG